VFVLAGWLSRDTLTGLVAQQKVVDRLHLDSAILDEEGIRAADSPETI
jgi:hypothetical protein